MKNLKIKNALENMTDEELMACWNTYCDETNDPDCMVYPMSEIGNLFYGVGVLDIIRTVDNNNFNANDDYIWFTAYGDELHSSDWLNGNDDVPIDIDGMADWAANNDHDLGDSGIREILDGLDDH